MMTNRARGVWAALLALLIAAQIPATALGGEAGKNFVPDPQPMPAMGDPDLTGGGIAYDPDYGSEALALFVANLTSRLVIRCHLSWRSSKSTSGLISTQRFAADHKREGRLR